MRLVIPELKFTSRDFFTSHCAVRAKRLSGTVRIFASTRRRGSPRFACCITAAEDRSLVREIVSLLRQSLSPAVDAGASPEVQSTIDWRFTTPDARIKLKRLYRAVLP